MNGKEVQTLTQAITFMGPLPNAAEFAGYEHAHPGTAERILALAEKEAAHRQETEKETVKNSFRLNFLGQILGKH
jgi:uncharacterized membrane protein